jgi:hypothetical protein
MRIILKRVLNRLNVIELSKLVNDRGIASLNEPKNKQG